ncbi:MAG: 4-(cytidine 5'-diphospho)-2-C-methyl-D-erythritol kinase [Alphaproteobacteria bacterium]
MPTQLARAKINLTLHVGRVIANQADPFYGYHPLDSLVVFADIADELSCQPAEKTTLTIAGPFANELSCDESNLVLKAYHALVRHAQCPPLAFALTKNLPVAAGIGGGSANAAAALRLMANYVDLPDNEWRDIALRLGADVPVCLESHTARMTGTGETVSAMPDMGTLSAVLINPGVTVMTRDIFKAFDSLSPKDTPRPQCSQGDLIARALDGRNDLEPAAIQAVPEVRECLMALASQGGCQLARMSGSGATVFGLFQTQTEALRAADALCKSMPMAWVQAVTLGDAA